MDRNVVIPNNDLKPLTDCIWVNLPWVSELVEMFIFYINSSMSVNILKPLDV